MSLAQQTQFVRANIYDASGRRTSVSIPQPDFDEYLAICHGSRVLLRRHMNAAAARLTPQPGVTRSAAIRAALEARMEQVKAVNC